MEKVTNGIIFLSLKQGFRSQQRELMIRECNAFFNPEENPAGETLEQFFPEDGQILKKKILEYIDREDFEFDHFLNDLYRFVRVSGYRSGEKNLVLMFTGITPPTDETVHINQPLQHLDIEKIAANNHKKSNTRQEINRLLEDLKMAEENAKRSDAIITSFLTNLSHEIRTPLNGIIGFSQYLKSVIQQENSVDEYFNVIINSGYRLLQIINDLLYYSRIKSGYVNIKREPCLLNKELDHVTSQMHSQKGKLKSGRLIIKKNYEFEDGRDQVVLDGYNLKEILNRLLDNAVKFTSEGYIELAYKRKNRDTLLFTVNDTGVGIPQEKGNAIFDEFIQCDDMYKRKFGGVGLGLVIAKKLVHQMGGEIGFESTEGKESCFYFSIPFQRETQDGLPSESNTGRYEKQEKEQS